MVEGVRELDDLSDGVKAAYEGAVLAYNAGLWGPAAVEARRTLEGIAKTLHPNPGSKVLATLLKQLPDHVDLAKPIVDVADLPRAGGNLGAHFDLDRDTINEDIARSLLELLDDLVEYLFLLPTGVERVRKSITGADDS